MPLPDRRRSGREGSQAAHGDLPRPLRAPRRPAPRRGGGPGDTGTPRRGTPPGQGPGQELTTPTPPTDHPFLVAEGLLSLSDIDGRFGPDAASATRKWQSRHGPTADGWVGDATWSKADDRMYGDGFERAEAAIRNGREGSVGFIRGNSDDPGDSADGGAYEQAGAPGDRLLVTGSR
ncbi:peptidoglycan-binding protein [Streptomyces sp. LRa12]|nr:peptidoglycan-binding protein [Streptomyces sp. LRa12]